MFEQYFDLKYITLPHEKILASPAIRLCLTKKNLNDFIFHKEIELTKSGLNSLFFHLVFLRGGEYEKMNYNGGKFNLFLSEVKFPKEIVFQTKNHNETIDIAKVLLNENSIHFLNSQLFDRFLSLLTLPVLKKYRLLKKWILKFHPLDQERFMLWGSSALWAFGLRAPNDIDCIISEFPPHEMLTPDFGEMVRKGPEGNGDRKTFDLIWVRHDDWKPWTEARLLEIMDILDITLDEWFYDPKNFFYFLGFKIPTIQFDIIRRQLRNRPKSIADLIGIKLLLYPNLIINPPELEGIKDKNSYDMNFVRSVKNSLKFRYEINVSSQEICQMLGV